MCETGGILQGDQCTHEMSKWIGANKGDASNPKYRSHLAGRGFNEYRDDSQYAPTAPLAAMRLILRDVATTDDNNNNNKGDQHNSAKVMVNLISRSYVNAPASRALFVELPPEGEEAQHGEVGRLHVCLYGTRVASKRWQLMLVTMHLQWIGFFKGRAHPSVFHHLAGGMTCLVHVDDDMSSGKVSDLNWLEAQLSKRYNIKTKRLKVVYGQQEVNIFSWIVHTATAGFEMEAGSRHSDLISEQYRARHKDYSEVNTPWPGVGEMTGSRLLE